MNRTKRLKTKGIYFLYRALQAFGLPWLLLYFLFRGFRNRGYWRSLGERFGFLPLSFKQTGPGAIWLHAVSVGELLSCVQFLRELRREFPRTRLFVSTSTLAGRAIAGEKLEGLADGIFYAPVDTVWAVRRVLRMLRPSLVLIAETELWPNLFREVKRTGAALAVVNGRISDRAFPRYLHLRWLFRAVLPSADRILAQSAEMGERFVALGAPPKRTPAAGNFKYDFEAREAPPDSPVRRLITRLQPAQVWIAASTMPPAEPGDVDEDDVVIAAFAELARRYPRLLLILVPRKPERFPIAGGKLAAAGLRYLRRSALTDSARIDLPGVLLLDSIGELSGLFAAADVVFMGGSLARRGGHNILEPAFFAKPVIVGPHMENFQAIAREFLAADACVEIGTSAALAGAVERLLDAPADAAALGRRALACAQAQRGATGRALAAARGLYDAGIPRYRPALPWLPMLWALSRLWTWGAWRGRKRAVRNQRRLDAPVISVGNLTMGGTGKTPCVLRLAEQLRGLGRRPGILTRGYGRTSPERHMVLAPGAAAFPERTGDEAQLFIRSGLAPVGIGADRYQTGLLMEQRFGLDVLLLDDGFQHRKLARTLDIVLIDALNPFGGGAVFPLGRLREPVSALARAGLVLLTRSHFNDLAPAIESQIRCWNPKAPIFRGRVRPRAWVENRTGVRHPLESRPFSRPTAFCGLGNPQSFRRTLDQMGVTLADWIEFGDHHRYHPHQLRRIALHSRAAGADALITTEKDSINLCEPCAEIAAPLEIYWLEVALEIENESEFLGYIEARLRRDAL